MFPHFEVLWITVYMTWLWIIAFLLCFIIVALALCKKWHQDFYKLFYRLPIALIITYLSWAYVYFFLNVWIFPTSKAELLSILNPYGYHFHFVWIMIWFVISLILFFLRIKRYESKQIWIDIMFFSTTISLIPLGIWLVFGDNFIWQYYTGRLSIKPLTTASELNKFWSVHPVWLYISFVAIISLLLWILIKAKAKKFGIWLWGFIILIIWINIVFMFQQYPKYWVISLWKMVFDIKHYISIFVILLCLGTFFTRRKNSQIQSTNNI